MRYTTLFAAFSFLANTVFVSALPHEGPTPTTASQITSMPTMHSRTKTSMLHHRTMSAPHGRHNSTMSKPLSRPHPPGCRCLTCMPSKPVATISVSHPTPGHVHLNITSASKHNCTDTYSSTDLPDPLVIARSFEWPSPSPSNITFQAVSGIKPPIAPKSVHGNNALAIGLAAAALVLVVGVPGVYVCLKERVKKRKGKGVVRASRAQGVEGGWDVREA